MPPQSGAGASDARRLSQWADRGESLAAGSDLAAGNAMGDHSGDMTLSESGLSASDVERLVEFRVLVDQKPNQPSRPVRRLRLTGSKYTLGSGSQCSIQIPDPRLSSMHAVLTHTLDRRSDEAHGGVGDDQSVILIQSEDHAIEVNGRSVTGARLAVGDMLRIGNHRFELLRSIYKQKRTERINPGLPAVAEEDAVWRRRLKQEIESWQKRQEEMATRELSLEHLQRDLDQRRQKLDRRSEHLDQRRRQIDDAERGYQDQLETAKRRLDESQRQAAAASEAVTKMRFQFEALNRQVDELTLQQRQHIDHHGVAIGEHERIRHQLETQRDAAINQRSREEVARREAQDRAREVAEQLSQSQRELDQAEQRIAMLDEAARTGQTALTEAQQRAAEAENELEQVRSSGQAAIDAAQSQIDATNEQLRQAEVDAEQAKDEAAEASRQLQDLQTTLEQTEADLAVRTSELADAQTTVDTLRQQSSELDDVVDSARKEAEELRDLYETSQSKVAQLEQSLADRSARDNDQAAAETTQLRSAMDHLSLELSNANEQLSQLRQENETLKGQISRLEADQASAKEATERDDAEAADHAAKVAGITGVIGGMTGLVSPSIWNDDSPSQTDPTDESQLDLVSGDADLEVPADEVASQEIAAEDEEIATEDDAASEFVVDEDSNLSDSIVNDSVEPEPHLGQPLGVDAEDQPETAEEDNPWPTYNDSLIADDVQADEDVQVADDVNGADDVNAVDDVDAASDVNVVDQDASEAWSESSSWHSEDQDPGDAPEQSVVVDPTPEPESLAAADSSQDETDDPWVSVALTDQSVETPVESQEDFSQNDSSAISIWNDESSWDVDSPKTETDVELGSAPETVANDQDGLTTGSLASSLIEDIDSAEQSDDEAEMVDQSSESAVQSDAEWTSTDDDYSAGDDEWGSEPESSEFTSGEAFDEDQPADESEVVASSDGDDWGSVEVENVEDSQTCMMTPGMIAEASVSEDSDHDSDQDSVHHFQDESPSADGSAFEDHGGEAYQDVAGDFGGAYDREIESDQQSESDQQFESVESWSEQESAEGVLLRQFENDSEGESSGDSADEDFTQQMMADAPSDDDAEGDFEAEMEAGDMEAGDMEAGDDVEVDAPVEMAAESAATTEIDPEDDSIEAYMNRLLGRVQGHSASSSAAKADSISMSSLTSPTKESETVEDVQASSSTDATPEVDDTPIVPRSQAPEKNSNLSAMRQLANDSARDAISISTAKQIKQIRMEAIKSFAGGGFCLLIGTIACSVAGSSMLQGVAILMTVVAIVICMYQGYTALQESRSRSSN